MRVLGWMLSLAVVLVLGLGVALWLGPREPVDRAIGFDPATLPEDLDAWLAARESEVPNLRPSAAKRILWAGAPGQRTPLALVYLHGFSASAPELSPVPEQVARALGANLFLTRLSGHGRDGAAMAEPRAGDWIEDAAEAMAIGRRLGQRVVLIGTSTGGTLATLAASDPVLSQGLAGVVLVSPNFEISSPAAPLLTLPWVRIWGPVVGGAERSFAPRSAAQAEYWTTRYPLVSLVPMAALVREVARTDLSRIAVPALFLYSPRDRVVSPEAIVAAQAAWGGRSVLVPVRPAETDDAFNHVIAGDALSPSKTPIVVDTIVDWLRLLP